MSAFFKEVPDEGTKKKGIFFMASALMCMVVAGLFVSCGSESVPEKELPEEQTGGMAFDTVEQFEIADGMPSIVKDGVLYQYTDSDNWQEVPEAGRLVQIVSDADNFCGLSEDGKVIHNVELTTEDMPLTGAFYYYMAQKLLEINEERRFLSLNGTLTGDFMVLAEDGVILYPDGDKYYFWQMEDTPTAVSGNYILTEAGNVYRLKLDPAYEEELPPKCIYDGGDIVAIDACGTTGEALGLTADGRVVAWGIRDRGEYTQISDWENVSSVVQGFHFALALTDDGNVLYADYSEENSKYISSALADWKGIVAITEWGTNMYGVKADGSLYSMEVTFDNVSAVKYDFESPLVNIKWGMMPEEVLKIMPTPAEALEWESIVTLTYEEKKVFGYSAEIEMTFVTEPQIGLYEMCVYLEDADRELLVEKLNQKYGDYTRVNSDGKPSQWDSETVGELPEDIQERFRVVKVEYPALKSNLANDFSQETIWKNLKNKPLVSVRLGNDTLYYDAEEMAAYRLFAEDTSYQAYLEYLGAEYQGH